ncbi:hypothetical protein P691DRAFT_783714 [Macrolepiota fuliginosa MF-IS2]|uniref:Uncharacterized protein n=1 Tax=Macrolepiota fuliginosa MF-IS2 TaxID=1400762 RepID=A0A9P5WY12_9AGAR|nr:hypothetical protein P691DRAFT_783714 [Macrolepiota fuliginosa MF-IS2]
MPQTWGSVHASTVLNTSCHLWGIVAPVCSRICKPPCHPCSAQIHLLAPGMAMPLDVEPIILIPDCLWEELLRDAIELEAETTPVIQPLPPSSSQVHIAKAMMVPSDCAAVMMEKTPKSFPHAKICIKLVSMANAIPTDLLTKGLPTALGAYQAKCFVSLHSDKTNPLNLGCTPHPLLDTKK